MNNDLISREDLKKQISELWSHDDGFDIWVKRFDVEDLIDNAPTVELDESIIQAVLNKRGMTAVANEYLVALHGKRPQDEWIICNQDNEGIHKIECPFCKYVCGSDFGDQITMTFQKLPNYCENCGAKMDGGADDDKQTSH